MGRQDLPEVAHVVEVVPQPAYAVVCSACGQFTASESYGSALDYKELHERTHPTRSDDTSPPPT